MAITKVLIANRGEIAIRVARATAELGIESVAIYPVDDEHSLHVRRAAAAVALDGVGAAAYLDGPQIVERALGCGCDAVHPGYGFLSESAEFATTCHEAGLVFVGPTPELLALFGDKARARAVAVDNDVPVLEGTTEATTLEGAGEFLASLGGAAMIVKAVAGGGGRGVRVVRAAGELEEAWSRCASEARAAFGSDELYVERFLERARHVEVQVLGDGESVRHLGERDCSLQRRHQKLVEIAPAPGLPDGLRSRIHSAAVRLATAVGYCSLGTFEFLIDASELGDDAYFAFIEANARLQVEHTVTEEVMGVDLVQVQLEIAAWRALSEVDLPPEPSVANGFAIQARVNMETMTAEGEVKPSGGTMSVFEVPSGPGIRVDSFGYSGYTTSPRFDSLLAKVVAHHPSDDFTRARDRLERSLGELRVDGVATNSTFLRSILLHPTALDGDLYTRFVDDHAGELVAVATEVSAAGSEESRAQGTGRAGATLDSSDPLAVLAFGREENPGGRAQAGATDVEVPDGTVAVRSPLQGTIVSVEVEVGAVVRAGELLVVMESMKMEHEIRAPTGGTVSRIDVAAGDTLWEGHALLLVEEAEVAGGGDAVEEAVNLDRIRPDLQEIYDRRAFGLDENRPEAVERRAAKGKRTARANVYDLVDDDTFLEYGPLVVAAQRRRRPLDELIRKTPHDGMVTGVGSINGDLFGDPACRCAVLAYDYTVLAGTQGTQNHRKTDRLIAVSMEQRLPLVLFAEGGGGRPGDTDKGVGGPGDTTTFTHFARLSGQVPTVGITTGRCFAGNASLLGCCDVIIATRDSNIGMGGPAMVEGGGLGVFLPEDIGPMSVQVPNGVVDIAVEDEAEAVAVTKKYLSYFQGRVESFEVPDQRRMRSVIPENRLRVYDVRNVIETLADTDSILELRSKFGLGMITSLIRVEGRSVGVVANNPVHLGGAIDSDGADKGARFLQLCDAFDIPVLFLCDTPGIMVGPEVEKTALVRHANRMFLIGANLSVPHFTIILRKAYGLGGIAMGGGSYKEPAFCVSWPTGEFGGMGLEGSVKLGYRNELAAIEDPDERTQRYEEMVAKAYEAGKALNQASQFAVDDTIDPAESRTWVAGMLRSVRPPPPREGKKRPAVDGW
ncbi:MAG: carboxyl transferase domain-containing protein [Acidobacteriota bacterium]|nr:carboxyl transferase domain-containing protein [Acidobacteriota bacterium]